ncbi:MAG: TonB-dependent receptor [Caulobacterales bacterium]|nr:TonB-dependent receptor [Caulobacterales bacterium]
MNYITKRPQAEGVELLTEIGLSTSLTQVESDGFEYLVTQGVSAKSGAADFIGNITLVDRGLFYDAEGRPLPPDPYGQTGIADMTEVSVFGKAGYDFSDHARGEVMGVHYTGNVDTDLTVGQGSFAGGAPSTATPAVQNNIDVGFFPAFDFIGERDPRNENTLVSSNLIFDDILGSSVKGQVFYQDNSLIWRHIDFLPFGLGGFGPDGSQLTTDAEKLGGRLDIETPLEFPLFDGFVLWGVDYLVDKVQEGLVDGRTRTSELKQTSVSGFAQFQGDVTNRLTVRGGVRVDDFELEVPDYASLDIFDPTGQLVHPVIGTTLEYDNIAGNLGATFAVSDHIDFFASWSEGFSIGDVMRTLRNLRPQSPSATPVTFVIADLGLQVEPTAVTSYEAGVRFSGGRYKASATGFFSESDLGATFDNVTFETVRAPEEIWGVELVADAEVSDAWRMGGNFVWQDSKVDSDGDGSLDEPLDFSRVPPPTLTLYTEFDVMSAWSVRLQSVTLLDDERFEPPFSTFERDVDGYTLFDLLVTGDVGPGVLSLGVENLLNSDAIPLATQLGCPDPVGSGAVIDAFCNIQQPGARGSVRYSVTY